MRTSIIGCGFIAEIHAQTIKSLGHELTAVVSRTPQQAKNFAQKWAVPHYGTSINLALAKSEVVHVCTPPMAHFELVQQALLAGKHVLCEKPLTILPSKAKALTALAEKKQLITAINFNVRYHDACSEAKRLINETPFGKLVLIHGHYLQEFHANSDKFNWRYQPENGGPMRATTEIGSHWIDLVRYWTGLEIEAVSATFSNIQKNRFLDQQGNWHLKASSSSKSIQVNSEDNALINFKFSNGVIGNVVLSEVAHGRKNQLKLEVIGQNKSVWWNNERPYQLHIGQKFQNYETINQPFGGGFSETFFQLFKDFYGAIDKASFSQRLPTFKDGLINAQICHAIFESATQQSAWIKIPTYE